MAAVFKLANTCMHSHATLLHVCTPIHLPQLAQHHAWHTQESDEPGTAAHSRYVRTHGAFAPGEQRRRPYDWAVTGVDPDSHRFGATDKAIITNGVGKALNPNLDEDAPKGMAIVNRRVEEHRLTNGEVLGEPRRIGAGDRNLPPGFTFGKPSLPKVCPGPMTPTCACGVPGPWSAVPVGESVQHATELRFGCT